MGQGRYGRCKLSKLIKYFTVISTISTLLGIFVIANDVDLADSTAPGPELSADSDENAQDQMLTGHAISEPAPTTSISEEEIVDYDDATFVNSQSSEDRTTISSGSGKEEKLDTNCDLFYILVSTIDGKVTALDLRNQGLQKWSVEADAKPLYSSSLANMEMIRNGKKMRVIPSLDGALYQFDGEKVEAVPMSAETLLSSTYKLSDDSMIVGSKDLRNYGINLENGQIQFTCSSDGCSNIQGQAKNDKIASDNIVLLTRTTQIVRSVDINNGVEKWNFSVGQHQVSLPPPPKQEHIDEDDGLNEDNDDYDSEGDFMPLFTSSKQKKCSTHKSSEDSDIENYLRLIVPEGKVVALSRGDVAGVMWEHKFETPIAKAWLLRNGKVEPMSLFDGRHIPTLGNFQPEDLENESMHQPLLYIGSHQKLLYIQPSPRMEAVLKSFPNRRVGHVIDPSIKVSWKPYLNTASVRTPIFSGNRPGIDHQRQEHVDRPQGALAVWHEDYPFDTGYFLYPEFRDTRSHPRDKDILLLENLKTKEASNKDILPSSLWDYWKQIIGLSLLMAVGIHMFVMKTWFNLSMTQDSLSGSTTDKLASGDSLQTMASSDSNKTLGSVSSATDTYESRFDTEFECLHCLGKGGFGVVFEAVHRLDYQHYAVKRIQLPKGKNAKEKVLRECRTMANLEHSGIVRYFNTWVESPPAGWQEEQDKRFVLSESSGPTSYSYSADYSKFHHPISPKRSAFTKKQKTPPGVCGEAELDTDSIVFSSRDSLQREVFSYKKTSSGEFSVQSSFTESSQSFGGLDSKSFGGDSCMFQLNSFSSESPSEDLSVSNTQSSIPFSSYSPQHSKHSLSRDADITDDSVVFEASSSKNNSSNIRNDSVVFDDTNVTNDSIVFEESKSVRKANNLCEKDSAYGRRSLGDSGTATENSDSTSFHGFQHNRHALEHTVDISVSGQDEGMGDDSNNPTKDSGNKCFLYIQMQLYQKETLKDWLTNHTQDRMSLHLDVSASFRETILDYFDQIVCAVDYVHRKGLMHRDLKPANIFFSNDGFIKVGDFGLVTDCLNKDAEDGADTTKPIDSGRHTAEVGTTLYMSPEQIARKPYDFKVDIFSLGLILLELYIPFGTQMERLRTIQDAKRQIFPKDFSTNFPKECELVEQMTSEKSSERPTTTDILNHPLLKEFAHLRLGRRRSRTISNNSNSSSKTSTQD